jgi:hypothetical protein
MASMHFTDSTKSRDSRLGSGQRCLHLVDIENLVGCPTLGCTAVAHVAAKYAEVAGVAPYDHVVVASSHHGAPGAWFGWPGARRLVRSGCDGADLALLEVLESEDPLARFDRVAVGSGDGIFAEPAARLQVAGCEVTVVSRPSALSRRLQLAAKDVRFLELEDTTRLVRDVPLRAA